MANCSVKAIFQVNCCAQRPSSVTTFQQMKNKLLSSFQKTSIKLPSPHAIIKKTSVELLHGLTDSLFQFVDNQSDDPSLSNFGPVEEIGEAIYVTDVQGAIPSDFPEGVYIRNGPNPLFGGLKSTKSIFGRSSHIWVEGEGMVHALYFKKQSDGEWCVSYNNKHIETETYMMEKERKNPSFLPAAEGDSLAILSAHFLNLMRYGTPSKLYSNTTVFEHGGKFYSVAEDHLPHEIDIRTLDTIEKWDVNGCWNRPFTAHPKKAPGSRELVIMGVNAVKPFFEVGIISDDGSKLVHKADLEFKRCTLSHEIGVTMRYNVILDFPLIVDLKRLANGGPLIKYDKEAYARIGVMPRYGDADSVKWFEVEPCCVFHIINTYEDENEVVLWACRSRNSIIPGPDYGLNKHEWFSSRFKDESDESLFAQAYEWRLNMETGEVKERFLTGKLHSMDFPMINENFTGFKNKHGYAQTVDMDASSFAGMPKYGGLVKLYLGDTSQQEYVEMEIHQLPKNTFCTGAIFVAKPGGIEEDDGWVITFVHDEEINISRVIIVDARKFTSEPVAIITLSSRVPYGFHGAFMPMTL